MTMAGTAALLLRSLRMERINERRPRIVITCPETGIAVISAIAFDDMSDPARAPALFKCPCGQTHKLEFVEKPANRRLARDKHAI